MEYASVARDVDFPPQLDQSEIEARCVRESFTWGPQALCLLCGLIWVFYVMVHDVPEVARNTAWIGAGATLLAALGVRYAVRRRKRQIALCPLGGRIGCYRGNVFQYSFTRQEMVRVRPDITGWIMIVLKQLLPMLLLMVIIGFLLLDGLKQPGPLHWQDAAVIIYTLLFAVFGFVAMVRTHFRLAFFWIPNGQGKTDQPLHLRRSELPKLEDGDGSAIG